MFYLIWIEGHQNHLAKKAYSTSNSRTNHGQALVNFMRMWKRHKEGALVSESKTRSFDIFCIFFHSSLGFLIFTFYINLFVPQYFSLLGCIRCKTF